MKKGLKSAALLLGGAMLVLGLTACGKEDTESKGAEGTEELAGNYYIDLTDLGMKLTFYLDLEQDGTFMFSNTLDFETNKSSGTWQKSGEDYMMVYDSVNGEEKSVSDGLTTTFTALEDGSLDFTGESGCIHYGSATASTVGADDPDAKLIAYPVTDDYEEQEEGTDFQSGVYVSEDVEEDGTSYSHVVSFYEDGSYLHLTTYEEDGQERFVSETGKYSVSTTQLAMEPEEKDRVACEVVDDSNLKLSILPYAGAESRETVDFQKTDAAEELMKLSGEGSVKGSSDTFEVTMTLYNDGSYETTADEFTETGVLAMDSETNFEKQYPDHPESGVRGLNQVTTVPAGEITGDGGKLTISGLRVRNSEELNRYECTVTQD